jgi:hypothetical protein
MALASWSSKRIVAVWAAGLVLQALLILAPLLIVRHLIGKLPEMRRVAAEQDDRFRTSELADSLSLVRQKADARAAGEYSITPSGDTLFALVHMPSNRPDSASIAAARTRVHRNARYISAIMFGLVPTILIVLTLSWMIARWNSAGPGARLRENHPNG